MITKRFELERFINFSVREWALGSLSRVIQTFVIILDILNDYITIKVLLLFLLRRIDLNLIFLRSLKASQCYLEGGLWAERLDREKYLLCIARLLLVSLNDPYMIDLSGLHVVEVALRRTILTNIFFKPFDVVHYERTIVIELKLIHVSLKLTLSLLSNFD